MAKEKEGQAQEYVNVRFPSGFAHPYRFEDKNGKVWDKAIVNIPPGTKMNGVDLTGYSVDVFLNERQADRAADGESITCGFKATEKIALFKGKGEERSELQVDPWDFASAVKEQREAYAAANAPEYANIKFPPGFAHPYQFEDKNGKVWDKAIVNIPPGTTMNETDLTGYSVDVFVNDQQLSQIANGESITCGFKVNETISLFKGKGEDREAIEAQPWDLAKAVKSQREEYAAEKAAERAAKEGPTSLADRAAAAKDASRSSGPDDGPALDPVAR